MSFPYLEWITRASEAANAQLSCAFCALQEKQNPFLQPTRVDDATQEVLDELLIKRKDLKCTVCSADGSNDPPSAGKEAATQQADPHDVNRPAMNMVNPEQHNNTDNKYAGNAQSGSTPNPVDPNSAETPTGDSHQELKELQVELAQQPQGNPEEHMAHEAPPAQENQ